MLRPVRHFTRKGYIEYRIESDKFPDGHWGFEDFTLTRHSNGDRVLRAHCELWDDDVLIRDVVQSVDKDFLPRDAYIRLTKGDAFLGAAIYRFENGQVSVEGVNTLTGVTSETRPFAPKIPGFGTHAVNSDGWLSAHFDMSTGPRIIQIEDLTLSSTDHRGASGPEIGDPIATTVEYFGDETVTVAAGTYRCHHFAFLTASNDHPPYHYWVTADGDFIFVKGQVAAPYHWTFELTKLDDWEPGLSHIK